MRDHHPTLNLVARIVMAVVVEDAVPHDIIGHRPAARVVDMKAIRAIVIDAVAVEQAVAAGPVHGVTPIGIGTAGPMIPARAVQITVDDLQVAAIADDEHIPARPPLPINLAVLKADMRRRVVERDASRGHRQAIENDVLLIRRKANPAAGQNWAFARIGRNRGRGVPRGATRGVDARGPEVDARIRPAPQVERIATREHADPLGNGLTRRGLGTRIAIGAGECHIVRRRVRDSGREEQGENAGDDTMHTFSFHERSHLVLTAILRIRQEADDQSGEGKAAGAGTGDYPE
jgi:hypothetical protein